MKFTVGAMFGKPALLLAAAAIFATALAAAEPSWTALTESDLPRTVTSIVVDDGALDRKRAKQWDMWAVRYNLAAPVARYTCLSNACPHIEIIDLRCSRAGAAATPCTMGLSNSRRHGPRCLINPSGAAPFLIPCPSGLRLK